MSDSTSPLDLIAESQSGKALTANALFDAMSACALFGRRAATTAGLTWGFYGGKFQKPDGTVVAVANGTVSLTASATNYLYADGAGVVQKATAAPSGWPGALAANAVSLYEIVTGASGVTSYIDWRAPLRGPAGSAANVAADIAAASSKSTPVDADLLALVDSEASNALKKLTWANVKAALKAYFDTLYAVKSQPFDLTAFYPGVPSASALVTRVPVARAVSFPANLANSVGIASVAATSSTAFDVRKNGTNVGTITFAAGAITATFATAGGAAFSLAAGDRLSIMAPASPDATLADVGFVLAGTR